MSKFYAVKIGRVAGVYHSWAECQKQITGFSGAVYKAFKTRSEALSFASGEVDPAIASADLDPTLASAESSQALSSDSFAPTLNPLEIIFYTDGSYQASKNYLGYGCYCQHAGQEFELSGTGTPEILRYYNIGPGVKVRNCTMEFLGFAETLRILSETGFDFSRYALRFKIDYVGVQNWMSGDWQCKEDYIKKIKHESERLLRQLGCKYVIEHVKGHSNVYGNERADQLATSLIDLNTLIALPKFL
jgi:ribonuclease HI